MTTVIFVHGIGTREPHFSKTFHHIKHSLHTIQKDLKVVPCFWGETLGSQLHAGGASIPLYDTTRGIMSDSEDGITEEDYHIALWEQLYRDPHYELRLLAAISEQSAVSFIPGQASPGMILHNRVEALSSHLPEEVFTRAGILDVFDEARKITTDLQAYNEIINNFSNIPEQGFYGLVIARAIIATTIALCNQKQQYAQISFDAILRDETIQEISKELDTDIQTRSVGSWMAKKLFKLAVTMGAMDHVQRKRGVITDAVNPFAGDILLYQGTGDAIRSFIRQCIQQTEPPVILLAHSLGGIACVDLLVMESLPEVKLLITVGSQAPLFYEINALHSLRFGKPLPSHFPAWLNIYDLRDFLSYIGAGVFHEKVQDVLVDNKQPFPQAHSAYWTNQALWKIIARRLANDHQP